MHTLIDGLVNLDLHRRQIGMIGVEFFFEGQISQ